MIEEQIRVGIANIINARMEEIGISKFELAIKTGLGLGNIYSLCEGKSVKLDTLIRVTNYIGLVIIIRGK